MKKQTALLLSTLVVMSAVSMQPAQAFKCPLKWFKKEKPAVVAPAKKEIVPVAVVKEEAKKEVPAVKTTPAAKPAVKPACPCAKSAVKPACPVAKPAAKAPVKK